VPCHEPVADLVRSRGAYLNLHSDGNVEPALDAIKRLRFRVVHPRKESAGMSFDRAQRGHFALMGGIGVQTTIGFSDLDRVRRELGALVDRYHDAGLILCTTHYVQDHCAVDEHEAVFDFVHERVRAAAR
jgi:uroporphyrinogen decarboxylase